MSFNHFINYPLGVCNSSLSVINRENSSAKPNYKFMFIQLDWFIQECCTAFTRQMSGNGRTFSDSNALLQISSNHQYRLDFTFGHLEYSLFFSTFWRPVFSSKAFWQLHYFLKRLSIVRGTEG